MPDYSLTLSNAFTSGHLYADLSNDSSAFKRLGYNVAIRTGYFSSANFDHNERGIDIDVKFHYSIADNLKILLGGRVYYSSDPHWGSNTIYQGLVGIDYTKDGFYARVAIRPTASNVDVSPLLPDLYLKYSF